KAKVKASEAEERAYEALVGLRLQKLDEKASSGGMLFRTTLEKALFSSPAACLQTIRNRVATSIDTIVHKLTGALERQAPAKLRFNWIGGKDEEYGQGHQAAVRTITVQRLADRAGTPLADVYELDYSKTLASRFDESTPLLKVLKLPLYLAPMTWPFLGLWLRKRMSAMEIAQLLVLTFIASLILLFMVLLSITASVAVLKLFGL